MSQLCSVVAVGVVLAGSLAPGWRPWPALRAAGPPGGMVAAAAAQSADRVAERQARAERTAQREQERRGRATQEARESRTFKTGDGDALSISNLAGDISVSARPGNEVRVDVVKRAFAESDESARRDLELATVEMEQRMGRLDIRTSHRGRHNRVEVNLTITAPPGTIVDIRSLSGDITLAGLSGEARAETVSGDIVATDVASLSTLKTMSGDIELTGCRSNSEMTASTVSGDLTASGVKARSCDFGSVSGSVSVREGLCERAAVRTIAGNLGYSGSLEKGGRYEFKTHSGDVRLVLDGRTGFEIDARSFNGALRSDLPLELRGPANASRSGRQSLQGVYGDGTAEILVTTFSGSVTIAKK